MAPGMLPMPPSTAAVKALMPARKPMKGLSLPMVMAISTPPTAARIAPITNVKEITVGVDAEQVGHVHVLRAGARGTAHA